MNKKIYYFNERNEDYALRFLAEKAKTTMQYNDYVVEMYHNYTRVFFGQSPKHFIDLVKLNTQSIVSNSPRVSCSSPKQSRISTSPVTTKKAVKKISTLQRKYLTFDSTGNEASQNVTTSQEKQSTPVKIIRSATESESSSQENLSLISSDKEVSPIAPTNLRMQSTPVKVNRNAIATENFSNKNLPLVYKAMDKGKPVNLEFHTPVRRQTVVVSPKKVERTILNSVSEVDRKYLNPTAQDPEMAGKTEADMRQRESSNEAVKMSSVFTVKVNEKLNTFKEVGVDGVLFTDDGKNAGPEENTTALDYRKSNYPAEETTENIQTSEDEKNYFSPVKKAKITNAKESVCSNDKAEMLARSVQYNKLNISPNQGSNLFKTFEGKRKSPSPRTRAVLFSSMPKIIQSSEAVEIEIDISCLSVENPSPTTSPVSLVDYKVMKTVSDEKTDKERSLKDVNLSPNESKPRCSKYISPTAKSSTSGITPVVENTNSPIGDDVINLGKDHLSNKPSEGNLPTNRSSETLSSPRIQNLDSKTLEYCITQLSSLISKREACMRPIYNSMVGFRRSLEYIITHMENIVHVIRNIPIVNKDYVTKNLLENVFGLISIASKFIKKLDSLKSDVQSYIDYWTKCFQQIHKIKSLNEPLMSNDKPLVCIEVLHTYEERLKEKWDTLDNTIPDVDSNVSLFLSTSGDLEKCINLFVKCLIIVGVLKPSTSVL